MILKKPYAFLIKHFKLIHFVLFLLSAFGMYKTSSVVSFFNSYVDNGYKIINQNLDLNNMIPTVVIIALLFIVIINVVIIFLFSNKQKRAAFYYAYTFYYIIFIVLVFAGNRITANMAEVSVAAETARAYRDIALIFFLPQIVYVLLCGARALGFNARQFNFKQDMKDLEVTAQDNEEVEVSFGLDTYKTARGIRRFIREFKYYVRENLLMVIVLSIAIVTAIAYIIVSSNKTYISYYKIGSQFDLQGLKVSIDDAIITNLDSGGTVIDKDKYYLLLKVSVENISNQDAIFEYNRLKLYYDKENYTEVVPNLDSKFWDYANPVNKGNIAALSKGTYVLPYEIDKTQINNKYYVKIYTGEVLGTGASYIANAVINLTPIVIDKVNLISSISMNETLNLTGTYLLNSSLTINAFEVTSKYIFNYTSCTSSNDCKEFKDIVSRSSTNEMLLVLTGTILLDKDAAFSKMASAETKFVNSFLKVEYTVKGETYVEKLTNVTPKSLKESYVFKTGSNLANADTINLLVTIRNKQYKIALKS